MFSSLLFAAALSLFIHEDNRGQRSVFLGRWSRWKVSMGWAVSAVAGCWGVVSSTMFFGAVE